MCVLVYVYIVLAAARDIIMFAFFCYSASSVKSKQLSRLLQALLHGASIVSTRSVCAFSCTLNIEWLLRFFFEVLLFQGFISELHVLLL